MLCFYVLLERSWAAAGYKPVKTSAAAEAACRFMITKMGRQQRKQSNMKEAPFVWSVVADGQTVTDQSSQLMGNWLAGQTGAGAGPPDGLSRGDELDCCIGTESTRHSEPACLTLSNLSKQLGICKKACLCGCHVRFQCNLLLDGWMAVGSRALGRKFYGQHIRQ
jgi:hypothetical protein